MPTPGFMAVFNIRGQAPQAATLKMSCSKTPSLQNLRLLLFSVITIPLRFSKCFLVMSKRSMGAGELLTTRTLKSHALGKRRKSHAFLRPSIKEKQKGNSFFLVEIGSNILRFPRMYDEIPCCVYLRLFSESCAFGNVSLARLHIRAVDFNIQGLGKQEKIC